jgi:uncharacterized membrane protein
VDVKKKEKKRKEKGKKKKYSQKCMLVFECFLWILFYDKIAKNKEEFNILICSRIKNYELTRKSYF